MSEPVKIISNSDLEGGPLTPGMSRSQAFATEDVWVGEVHTAPSTMSGWHHHGDHATYGRVIEGTARVEFGPGGQTTLEAGPGDFFYVPPHTVHREGNAGEQTQVLMVVRLGSGPTVINMDGPENG